MADGTSRQKNYYTDGLGNNSTNIGKTFGGNINDITTEFRDDQLGKVQGSYSKLYALTEDSEALIASKYGSSEGNIFVHSNGAPMTTMNNNNWKPLKGSSIFSSTHRDTPSWYGKRYIDIDTQKMLRQAGIDIIDGIPIPENPTKPLDTRTTKRIGNIHESGIFSEIADTDSSISAAQREDGRYIVTTRIPDSYTYHYEKNKNNPTISPLKKGRPQFEKPTIMSDPTFEDELAKARYLSGMEPYLDDISARKFDHFTYWKYKTPNSSVSFRGAYIHIFISRPDIHIFDRSKSGLVLRSDVASYPELASIIYTHPDCAQSLVQKWQTGAMSDINLFLSNHATGIQLSNERIDDHSFVEAFNGIKPTYGGRMNVPEGELEITFNETQDLSVTNTMLLWMKYIHATYTGNISPLMCDSSLSRSSFNKNDYHLYPMWRKLDSLASIYVFATDMTQRQVIFWRKYFGVYPKSTSFAGLSASGEGKIVEGVRKVNIPFQYVTYRTNNIVDLYAFNCLSDLRRIIGTPTSMMQDNVYQTFDRTVSTEHDQISGIPFIAIEQHVRNSFDSYNKILPGKMYRPQLLFARSDGAFIPTDPAKYAEEWINKYWGSPMRYQNTQA